MVVDPICGMQVEEQGAEWTSAHEGERYYFCAKGCKQKFDEDPAKYVRKEDAGGEGRSAGS